MCTHVCAYSYTQAHFGNSSNRTISIDAIVDGEFQELHPNNPSWPIIAGILFPQIHHTENMSKALGNNPRLRHAEKGKLSLGRAGFGLPGAAQNTWGVSDSISRYHREGSVIGKCCPSRKLALFNKQCLLKKFKIFQRTNAAPHAAFGVLELAKMDWFQPPSASSNSCTHAIRQLTRCKIFKIPHASHQSSGQNFLL